jgi:hypothetical protein
MLDGLQTRWHPEVSSAQNWDVDSEQLSNDRPNDPKSQNRPMEIGQENSDDAGPQHRFFPLSRPSPSTLASS